MFLSVHWSIVSSLFICLVCILVFLRVLGKTQVSQMTPLDTVNAFVIGAMVGGVVYEPRISVWYFVFAILVWTALNYVVRILSRYNVFTKMLYGTTEYLMKNGKINLALLRKNNMDLEELKAILREHDIYSLTDVKDVIFEANGNFSITTRRNRQDSYILIDNGEVLEEALKDAGKSKEWLLEHIKELQLGAEDEIFALEWTPGKGFYVIDKDGFIKTKDYR